MKFVLIFLAGALYLSTSHATDLELQEPDSVSQKLKAVIAKNQTHFECTIENSDGKTVLQTNNLLENMDGEGFNITWNQGDYRLKGFVREPADGNFLRSNVVLYRDTPFNVNALTIFSGDIWLDGRHKKFSYKDGTAVSIYIADTIFFTDPAQFNKPERDWAASMQLTCFAFLPKE